MASVSYEKVHKTYADGTPALIDFDLAVADGEFMVLVGPSGCGKSTALRLLAGLEDVSAGRLLIDTDVVNGRTPQQRDVAMVFQNYALYPHMTVRDNLAFPLRMRKLERDAIARRVDETARLLDLTALLERKPPQLSGGERQRVAMGRAIVRAPRVFLMDEPLSNLDARLRLQIRSEIATLQRRLGITTLYVTHDQVEAMTLGQRVAVLNRGRLQQVGEPQTLYDHPANIFVATFIGSPGMNLFPATVQSGAHGPELRFCGLSVPIADLPAALKTGLDERSDMTVTVGLRPEAFALQAGTHALAMTVHAVETLGHEQLIHGAPVNEASAATGGGSATESVIARLPGAPSPRVGDRLMLRFDMERMYCFDVQGQAIA